MNGGGGTSTDRLSKDPNVATANDCELNVGEGVLGVSNGIRGKPKHW